MDCLSERHMNQRRDCTMFAKEDSFVKEYPRRRKRRPQRRTGNCNDSPSKDNGMMRSGLFRMIVAILFIRADAFHVPSTVFRPKPLPTSHCAGHRNVQFQFQDSRSPNERRTRQLTFITTRFAEPPTKSLQEEVLETISASNVNSSFSDLDKERDDIVGGNHTNAVTNRTLEGSTPFFATAVVNETIDDTNSNSIAEQEGERFGYVTRRDVFRYGAVLTSAVLVTGMTYTHTDPEKKTKKPLESILPSPPPLQPQAPVPQAAVQTPRLEPVNLTKVASQTNINVTMNCEKMCVSIDSSNFTFNKVERAKTPDWLPRFLAPKSQVVKKIPNSELLVAATAAGSVTEMMRTSLLYPLQTVKIRLQADRNANVNVVDPNSSNTPLGTMPRDYPPLSEQLQTLGANIRQKIDEGNLYAGISPTLLVSVPATGIYYGVRDVTKRLLFMTPLDSTWIAVGGALVGDVVSLCFRVPSDALAIRLQTQKQPSSSSAAETSSETEDGSTAELEMEIEIEEDWKAGDWLGDSVRRLPMVILTDLPYLLSKIVLNKSLIQGNMSVSEYALFAAVASIVAGFLTTPFDVARTRILLDKWSVDEKEESDETDAVMVAAAQHVETDPINGAPLGGSGKALPQEPPAEINNPGDSVLRTMIQITKEGDGGIANLFSGWLERVVYLGIGRAWLEPIQLIGYIGIRDAVLLEWF